MKYIKISLWTFLTLLFCVTANAKEAKVADLPKEAIKAMYIAQQALQEKNYNQAIKALETYMAAASQPVPLPAFQMLGYAWYEKNEPEKTRQVYEKAHQAFPDNAEMLQNYTILTYETGNLKKAGKLFEELYRLKGSNSPEILYQASGVYYQAEQFEDAKRVLAQLLTSKAPKEPKWYEDMIAVCVALNDRPGIEKWVKVYLEKDPSQSRYWRLLAQTHLDRDEYALAASSLEIAYRLENAKPNEWKELSDLYMYLNAPFMVIRCLKKAFDNNIPEEQKIRIAGLYAKTQRFDEAISWLDAAYRETPSPRLLFEKGRILYDAGRYKEAIQQFDACTKADKKMGDAFILAGFAAWNMQAFEKARSFFAQATSLPKYREQANDAVVVLDDLMAAISKTGK